MKKNEGMTLVVCDKIVKLTAEEVQTMNAEIRRRMGEDKPMCSSTKHYDSEGNRCNEDKGCVCNEIIADTVYGANEKVSAMWKSRLAAQRRKRCGCHHTEGGYYTCDRCQTIQVWEEDWSATTSEIGWDF
jgi:hypothetical protein